MTRKEKNDVPQKGSVVSFGTYPQTAQADTCSAIAWKVLHTEEKNALLISCCGLDARAYHERQQAVSWEESSLRQWLNEVFFETAFTKEEQVRIQSVLLSNEANPEWGPFGGRDTEDRVFLLSCAEAYLYFGTNESRICMPSAHALVSGARSSGVAGRGDESSGNIARADQTTFEAQSGFDWWLRTPGSRPYYAMAVQPDGALRSYGYVVSHKTLLVRPAIVVSF